MGADNSMRRSEQCTGVSVAFVSYENAREPKGIKSLFLFATDLIYAGCHYRNHPINR